MTLPQRLAATLLACTTLLAAAAVARAEGDGQEALDEALRVRATGEGLRALNETIELLEQSLDEGLDVDSSNFAELMLSGALLERAMQLAAVIDQVPEEQISDPRMQRIRALATSDLRRVLTYDDAPGEATYILAKLLVLPGGDPREARRLIDRLIERGPLDSLRPAEQAEAYGLRASLQPNDESALADYARAIELAVDDAEFRLKRAEYLFEHDRVDEALAEVDAVVQQTPDQIPAYLLQAQILRVLQRYDEALETLNKVADLAPGSIIPYQYRGEILRETDRFAEAIDEFSRVLQIEPGLDAALLRRAEVYLLTGDLNEALEDVDALLAADPNLVVAHALRGQALAGLRRFREAIVEMELLAKELPGQPDVRMQLATYYVLNKQPDKAIDAYSDVLELDADNYFALRGRGDAYLSVGDHESAIADFERARSIQGDDSVLLNNLAWVLATSPDDDVRDASRSQQYARRACELTDYRRPHILSTLAAALAEAGDFSAARDWMREAIAINQVDLDAALKTADEEQTAYLTEMADELERELASYLENAPWRERQTVAAATENPAASDASSDVLDGELPGEPDASVQDPSERPTTAQESADAAH